MFSKIQKLFAKSRLEHEPREQVDTRDTPQVNFFKAENIKINDGSFTINNIIGDPLDKLKHVSSAGIDALNEDGCMKGTRVSLLEELHQWSEDIFAPPIFWLDGMAGTGKSAIARSFCRFLYQNQCLGGSFFCLRGHESRANVKRILPTLAWFLASKLSQYQTALLPILREAPDVADCSIPRQIELLLETPFHRVSDNRQRRPLVLVIDALDECANPEEVRQLLDSLLSISKGLPVKIFLTSRPERHIVENFESLQSESHLILRLHDIEQDLVEADISLFLDTQLRNIRTSRRSPRFPSNWPTCKDIEILTRLSGKLFIYDSTAVKFIAVKNPVDRLQTLTSLRAETFFTPKSSKPNESTRISNDLLTTPSRNTGLSPLPFSSPYANESSSQWSLNRRAFQRTAKSSAPSVAQSCTPDITYGSTYHLPPGVTPDTRRTFEYLRPTPAEGANPTNVKRNRRFSVPTPFSTSSPVPSARPSSRNTRPFGKRWSRIAESEH